MHFQKLIVRIALSTVAVCAFAADAPLPKADTILDKYIELTGGKARYEKLKTQISTGTFEIPSQGVSGTITIYRAAPNKARSVIDLGQIGKIEEGSDANVAWQVSPMTGPRIKQGGEKAFSMRAAIFNGEIMWRDHYDKVETVALEKVGDKDCYKVVMSGKDANPQTRYYEKKTNLPVKITLTAITPAGDVPADTLPSDFREEDGIISPHKLVQSAGGQQVVITIEKVQYNTDIPASMFEPPAEVKQLMSAPAN